MRELDPDEVATILLLLASLCALVAAILLLAD